MSLNKEKQSIDVFKEQNYFKENISNQSQNNNWIEILKNKTRQSEITNDIIFSSKRKIKLEDRSKWTFNKNKRI